MGDWHRQRQGCRVQAPGGEGAQGERARDGLREDELRGVAAGLPAAQGLHLHDFVVIGHVEEATVRQERMRWLAHVQHLLEVGNGRCEGKDRGFFGAVLWAHATGLS